MLTVRPGGAAILNTDLTSYTTINTLGGNALRHATKTQTYAVGAGTGTAGTPVTLFTVTGEVNILSIAAWCSTGLTESGATATIALGITGSTSLFIAATNAVDIDTGEFWVDTAPDANGVLIPTIMKDTYITDNIINTIATTNVTGGVIRYDVYWLPLSSDGNVA